MTLRAIVLSLTVTVSASALAASAAADPPGRVGRVSYVEGAVSFQPPESQDWTAADVNYPVAASEAFWTGDSGRAELQVGAVAARLDSETELDISDLRYGAMRLGLPQGSVEFELRDAPQGGLAVSTPAGDIQINDPGIYRIDVGAPPDDGSYPAVEVTVLRGQAQAPAPGGYAPVYEGQAAVLYAGYDPQFQDAQDAAIDDFARQRDQRRQWRAPQYLPAAMTGVEDLGGYGDFTSTPDYGQVWFPRDVPSDWAPYRDGRWVYIAPWGYTWVDRQPWGFAPFHYGRWAQFDGRWGWVPGRPDPQPVYAPALVAFLGGVALSLGGGDSLGWVPLGPGEAYRPSYQVSEAYERRLNAPHVSNFTPGAAYAQERPLRNLQAATVVRAATLTTGAQVRRATVALPPQALANAAAAPPQVKAPPPPAVRPGAGAAAGMVKAAPPPQKLQAVRTAVSAPPPSPGRPPVIAGARPAPPPPAPPAAQGGRPPALVAPSQVHNPAAQGRAPIPPPAAPPPVRQARPPAPANLPPPGAAPSPARPRPPAAAELYGAPPPAAPVRQARPPAPPSVAPPPAPPRPPRPPVAAEPYGPPPPAAVRPPPAPRPLPREMRAPPPRPAPPPPPPEPRPAARPRPPAPPPQAQPPARTPTPAEVKARQDEARKRAAQQGGTPPP